MRKKVVLLLVTAVLLIGFLLLRRGGHQAGGVQLEAVRAGSPGGGRPTVEPMLGRFRSRPPAIPRGGNSALHERDVLARMHVAFAGLPLDPENASFLSNIVLVATAARMERLKNLTAREIAELERRDVASSHTFHGPEGMEFRNVLERHGLTGSRMDRFRRLAMEINFTWNRLAPSTFDEDQEPVEIREIMRRNHAASAARAEALRDGFLVLTRECFFGLNINTDALMQDILALPEPESPPPFNWPGPP